MSESESDLKTLRKRLADELEHLRWFEESGQAIGPDGAGTAEYLANSRSKIAKLERQIADIGGKRT